MRTALVHRVSAVLAHLLRRSLGPHWVEDVGEALGAVDAPGFAEESADRETRWAERESVRVESDAADFGRVLIAVAGEGDAGVLGGDEHVEVPLRLTLFAAHPRGRFPLVFEDRAVEL